MAAAQTRGRPSMASWTRWVAGPLVHAIPQELLACTCSCSTALWLHGQVAQWAQVWRAALLQGCLYRPWPGVTLPAHGQQSRSCCSIAWVQSVPAVMPQQCKRVKAGCPAGATILMQLERGSCNFRAAMCSCEQVRLWRVERSQKDILKWMRADGPGLDPKQELLAYWKFDDPDS